jgi:SAM-dependent methyltransferase
VVGVDLSEELLAEACRAAAEESPEVRHRLEFVGGDLLALEQGHLDSYDLVCCHGVAMYLPSLDETIAALCRACRAGGLVSVLTRNRAGIAMRAGMMGDWTGALRAFDARYYDNRIGLEAVRADEPREVQDSLLRHGASVVAWYGVRLFTDHWGREHPGDDFAELVAAEEEAGRRDPYRSLAALTHTIARAGSSGR